MLDWIEQKSEIGFARFSKSLRISKQREKGRSKYIQYNINFIRAILLKIAYLMSLVNRFNERIDSASS